MLKREDYNIKDKFPHYIIVQNVDDMTLVLTVTGEFSPVMQFGYRFNSFNDVACVANALERAGMRKVNSMGVLV